MSWVRPRFYSKQAQHSGTARHSTAQHSIAQHSTARHSTGHSTGGCCASSAEPIRGSHFRSTTPCDRWLREGSHGVCSKREQPAATTRCRYTPVVAHVPAVILDHDALAIIIGTVVAWRLLHKTRYSHSRPLRTPVFPSAMQLRGQALCAYHASVLAGLEDRLGVDNTIYWNLVVVIASPGGRRLLGVASWRLNAHGFTIRLSCAPAVRIVDVLQSLAVVGAAAVPPGLVEGIAREGVVADASVSQMCVQLRG